MPREHVQSGDWQLARAGLAHQQWAYAGGAAHQRPVGWLVSARFRRALPVHVPVHMPALHLYGASGPPHKSSSAQSPYLVSLFPLHLVACEAGRHFCQEWLLSLFGLHQCEYCSLEKPAIPPCLFCPAAYTPSVCILLAGHFSENILFADTVQGAAHCAVSAGAVDGFADRTAYCLHFGPPQVPAVWW